MFSTKRPDPEILISIPEVSARGIPNHTSPSSLHDKRESPQRINDTIIDSMFNKFVTNYLLHLPASPQHRDNGTIVFPTPKSTPTFKTPLDTLVVQLASATINTTRSSSTQFDGMCMDTGAQISVSGKAQAMAYCHSRGIPFYLTPSVTKFKFGDHVSPSLGRLQVRIPTPNQSGNVSFTMDVVDLDVPMLLGLRELRAASLLVDYLDNRLICKNDNWSCLLYTSPSPRDQRGSRMPSSA